MFRTSTCSPTRFPALYSPHQIIVSMSDHEHEGHFPEQAEQNEIGGPVVLAIMILGMVILILWASC